MTKTIQTPPRTIMEVYKMLPEGTLAELIDNIIYMPPSPSSNHQEISIDLASQIHLFCKQNKRARFMQPRLMFILMKQAMQFNLILLLYLMNN